MTPGARLQAVIEILKSLETTDEALDSVLRRWARKSRFAGSKDRAAIKELCFTLMRERGVLAAAFGREDARSLTLSYLARSEGRALDDAQALFDGSTYSPSPLTEAEAARYTQAASFTPSPKDILHGPDWLMDHIMVPEGSSLTAELDALSERAPIDLRVNTLKADRGAVVSKLQEDGMDVRSTPISGLGVRLSPPQSGERSPDIRHHSVFTSGQVEIQDEGFQIASMLVDARPGMQVLDLCAGAGGKSLALAASMANKGQILATDVNYSRLKSAKERFQRAGLRNVQTKVIQDWAPADGGDDPDFTAQEAAFDRVVLDVPCSGSGAWRRNPDAKWRLTPEKLDDYVAAQARLLARAAPLVNPGGRLIYITCSVLKMENSNQIQRFMRDFSDFSFVDMERLWRTQALLNQKVWDTRFRKQGPGFLLLSPESSNTDGTFVAVLQRDG